MRRELRRTLQTPASGRWREAQIGEVLTRLSDAFGVPMWIDRRLDPQAPLTLTVDERALGEMLDEIAATQDFATAAVGPLVYVGPTKSAEALPTIVAEWRKTAPASWRKRTPVEWKRFATPRVLVDSVAAAAGARIAEPNPLPHDLWPSQTLPAMRMSDQLALLLVGFDMRPQTDEGDDDLVAIAPIDYGAVQAARKRPRAPARKRATDQASQRYTLRVVEQPVGSVLNQLAERLGYEVRASAVEEGVLERRITFDVEKVTIDGLFEAIGDAAAVSVRREDDAIVIRPLP